MKLKARRVHFKLTDSILVLEVRRTAVASFIYVWLALLKVVTTDSIETKIRIVLIAYSSLILFIISESVQMPQCKRSASYCLDHGRISGKVYIRIGVRYVSRVIDGVGTRGSVVVKALYYKRAFETQ
jgi:hypothetical protein